MATTQGEQAPICPDPSAHPQTSLQDSASKAALLASNPSRNSTSSRDVEALGPDGKLSAAGAATSLRYASAKDLPSFPSVGIDTATSGNKAANLANSNQKPIELWKPDASSSASKAALLASRDGGKLDLWEYKADGTGHSAATIAMGKKSSSPSVDLGYTEEGRRRALLAATKSLSVRDRPKSSDSEPARESYPDQANASFNALNAATVAGRPTSRISGADAARIQNMQGVSRDMYGDRPPIALEVEEQRHKEALRASAVTMAQQLYNLEKADVDRSIHSPGSVVADRVAAQSFGAATTHLEGDALRVQAMNYSKVQELAQKLAAERLAKLDPDGVMAYREHYGYGRNPPKSDSTGAVGSTTRMGSTSGFGTTRRGRPTNREPDDSDDEAQAAKIKSQMSHFNSQVATVDAKKRTQDREALMAAAERIVQARMHTMDEKIFAETGKIPPSMMEEWEAKARAKATADSDTRMQNHGKVHIGGGKFMDQSEVNAIAAARMQPTLDEINDEAERRRAHEEAVRLDLERHKEQAEVEKQRDREVKQDMKRAQDEEKERQRQERAVEKEKARLAKEEEKERLKTDKMQRDLEKRMSKTEQKQQKEAQKKDKDWEARQQQLEAERVRNANAAASVPEPKVVESKEAPVVTEPVVTEPVVTEPVVTEPVATEPVATEPSSSTGGGLLGFLHNRGVLEETAPIVPGTTDTTPVVPTTAEETTAVPDTVTKDPEPIVPATIEGTREAPSAVIVPSAAAASTSTRTTETSTSGRRDSRVKSFLGKFKRSSKAEADGSEPKTTSATAIQPAPMEPSETAKGKQPAGISPMASDVEDDTDDDRGRTDTSTEVFEEARDKFDSESDAPRGSFARESTTGSPTPTASRFQEEL